MTLPRLPKERTSCELLRIIRTLCVTVLLLGSLAGCGDEEWQAKTYPASGQISINGQPPEGAVITLHPISERVDKRGSNPWGIVQEGGTYSLSTYERGDGAPAGEYAVTVRWPRDVTDMSAAMTDRLNGVYAKVERSKWSVTITEGENVLPPIEIDGAKVLSKEKAAAPRQAPPGPVTGK